MVDNKDLFEIAQQCYLPTMPEDNFMECIAIIAETMKGTRWVGEWYGKCFATENVPCNSPTSGIFVYLFVCLFIS